MRFILNMSHARCLFAQRVYAAQLTPGVLQKALPSSSAMINKIFKAILILRGEKPAGTKGRAELMLLLVPSTKKSNRKGWTWLCGSELRDASASFAGRGAAVPLSPSLATPAGQKLRQHPAPPAGLIHPAERAETPMVGDPFSTTPSTCGEESPTATGPVSRSVCSFSRVLLPAGTSCQPSCPCPGPCRPPTRRPSASARAGASGRAGASAPTAASARAASPPAPPGTPCPGIYPSMSRGRGRAKIRCWTRPRGLSSGSQVRQRLVGSPRGFAVPEMLLGSSLDPTAPQGAWMGAERRGGVDAALVAEEQGGGSSLPWLCPLQARSGRFIPSALGFRDDCAPPARGLGDIKMLNEGLNGSLVEQCPRLNSGEEFTGGGLGFPPG